MRKTTMELGRKIARATAWILALAIVVLSLVPPALRPESGAPRDLEHFLIYYAAGLAFTVGYDLRCSSPPPL